MLAVSKAIETKQAWMLFKHSPLQTESLKTFRLQARVNLRRTSEALAVHKETFKAHSSRVGATSTQLEYQFYKCVRLFLLISQLFLCAPIGAHQQHRKNGGIARLLLVLHLLWCLLLYTTISTCIYMEYTQSNVDLPTVQKPLFFSEYLVYMAHIFHIIMSTYRARHKFRTFIHIIVSFDRMLLQFRMHSNYELLRHFLNGHLLLILLHLISTVIVDYFYSGCTVVGFVRSAIVYVLPNMILEISLIQYYGLLYAIALRSVQLNYVLQLQLPKAALEPLLLHQHLHRIRLLYSKLEIFTAEVNDAFAPSVVLVYIGSFINISVNIFLIYKYMDDISHALWAWLLFCVIWTFMHIGKMFLILYYNHCVQDQVIQYMRECELLEMCREARRERPKVSVLVSDMH